MSYVTVESIVCSPTTGVGVCFRLTYEVRPLREGMESWFLVSIEEMVPESASKPK